MSSRPGPGLIKQLWYKWRTLKLPWRKQFLVGADLSGNTFWEFQDQLNPNSSKWRRIVRYSSKAHYGDVRISPQWHQWLRHTRLAAPTIQEQQYEVSRQAMMKQRAAEADERWKSIPSYHDAPNKPQLQQSTPGTAVTDSKPPDAAAPEENIGGVHSVVGDEHEVAEASRGEEPSRARAKTERKERESSPWDAAKRGDNKWEPASWVPGVAQRR